MSQINLQQLWISYAIQNPPPVPGSPAEVVKEYNEKWEEYKHSMLSVNPTLNRETHPVEEEGWSDVDESEKFKNYTGDWKDFEQSPLETNPTLDRETHSVEEDGWTTADEPQEYEDYEEYEAYEDWTTVDEPQENDVFEGYEATDDFDTEGYLKYGSSCGSISPNIGEDASYSDDEAIDVADLLKDDGIFAPAVYIADHCNYLIEQIEHLHGVLLTSLDGYRRCYDFCSFKAQEALLLSKAEEMLKIHELSYKAFKKKTEVFGYLGNQY